tara:strand:- start:228 stop:395 length:168 start_codon:yes stop_codon:yes gene_type:complete
LISKEASLEIGKSKKKLKIIPDKTNKSRCRAKGKNYFSTREKDTNIKIIIFKVKT